MCWISVATKDWWTTAKNGTYGTFSVKQGQTAGNIVGITAPNVQMTDPKYSDSNGVAMMDFGMALTPKSATGNDEIRICTK